jgi:hypothetical protein
VVRYLYKGKLVSRAMLLHFGGTKNVVSFFLSPGRVSDWAADVPFVTTNGSPFARAVLFPSKERERVPYL